MASIISRRDQIISAFEALGGQSKLPALYAEIERQIGANLTTGQKAGVRREIENHSCDSKNYREPRQKLFVSVGGIGSGIWALKKLSSIEDDVQDGAEAFIETTEGQQRLKLHLSRERSRSLIRRFKASLKSLECQVCKFDFQEKYGAHGAGYIEAHHTIPISQLTDAMITKLSDLAAVCANCHRMLHRDGLISVDQLKSIVKF